MFDNLIYFLKSITFIDYIFFFTVVFLIVLVVSLIYFIKINEDVLEEEKPLNDPDNLSAIANSIKTEPKTIKLTNYEQEQESKAIISYDELLENTGEFKLNYLEDENIKSDADIEVKKVDLNNLIKEPTNEETPKMEVHLISLAKEEEFLKTLKELQKLLN